MTNKMKSTVAGLLVILATLAVLSACSTRTILGDLTGEDNGRKLHIWFVKTAGDQLTLVEVSRQSGRGDSVKQSVEDLLTGPSGQEIQAGLGSEIPRGTILLGVEEKAGTIELNLSRRFASGGGSSSLETRIEQLRRTVTDSAGSKKVFLNVEGHRLTSASGEGLEIKQPIN